MSKTTSTQKSSSNSSVTASSNWLALRKTLPSKGKKRKADAALPASESTASSKRPKTTDFARGATSTREDEPSTSQPKHRNDARIDRSIKLPTSKNGESISGLQAMVAGELEYTDEKRQPGRYLALDCEMVGVGPEGAESSLARVSLVNFHGAVQLDVFVRQRERVVDYRTEFSGVRPQDMVHARSFDDVVQEVAKLIDGRILVGHALHNDMKALLLSHPRQDTRDTQYLAWKHKLVKTNRIALRNLVREELGIIIQGGEHSSVTDARATMAVFRCHRKQWDKGQRSRPEEPSKKRKSTDASIAADEDQNEDEGSDDALPKKLKPKEYPGSGRKGLSSGLSVVVKRRGGGSADGRSKARGSGSTAGTAGDWWKKL